MTNKNINGKNSEYRSAPKHGRLAIFWTILGVIGSIAVIPYTMEINASLLEQVPFPLPVLVLLQSVQIGILLLIGNFVGLRLGASIGLDSPLARALIYRSSAPKPSLKKFVTSIITGFSAGLIDMQSIQSGEQTTTCLPSQHVLPQRARRFAEIKDSNGYALRDP